MTKLGIEPFLYALVLSLPLSIAAVHVCLGILILLWGYQYAIKREPWVHTSLDRPILIYLSAVLAAALFGVNPGRSILHILALWHIVLYLYVVKWVPDQTLARRLIWTLFGSAALNGIYGIAQHVGGGLDLFRFGGAERIFKIDGQVRASGVFDHYMTFSGQMLLLGLLGTGLLLFWARGRTRWILAGAVLVFFCAVWSSFTRNAWVGLGAGFFAIALFKERRTMIVLVAGLLLTVVLLSVADRGFRTRAVSTVKIHEGSTVERFEIWRATLEMIKDHSLLGVGIGNFTTVFDRYRDRTGAGAHSHAHNTLLQITAESGLIGLAAYLYLWYAFFRMMIRRAMTSADPFVRGVTIGAIGALVGFHVAGLFEYNLGDSEVDAMMWFVVGLGMMAQNMGLQEAAAFDKSVVSKAALA
ncbi:MAG TPA: O-antigen ligase family protein [Nitrospiria bacterium]|nr:O-antigen ligase family protein [Nitrospiria bacterium]HUK56440.1 O-antigen ligase family protein [Nitrospiria bacterium]